MIPTDDAKTRARLLDEIAALRSEIAALRKQSEANMPRNDHAIPGSPGASGVRDSALLAAVLDSTEDVIFVKDVSGKYLLLNRAGQELFGCPEDEAIGLTDAELFPDESSRQIAIARADDLLAMGCASGERLRKEETVATPQGQRHYLTTKSPYVDSTGQVIGVIGVARDVTELIHARASAEAGQARLQELADHMPQIVWTARPDGYLDYYNRRWYEIAGAPQDAYGHSSWSPHIHPDDLPHATSCWQAAVRSGQEMTGNEFRLYNAQIREYRWHLGLAVPVRGAHGQIERWIGTTTDIHVRKLAEEAMRRSEERLRLAAEAAGFGTYDVDLRSGRSYWSAQTRRIFGVPDDVDPYQYMSSVPSFVHPEDRDRVNNLTLRSCQPGAPEEVNDEHRIVREDGQLRWVLLKGRTYFEGEGSNRKPVRLMGVFVDVTKRKSAENALREAYSQSEERLRHLLDTLPQVVWVTGADGSSEFYNRRWHEFIGRSGGSTYNESLSGIVHPEDQALARLRWEHSLATGEPYEVEFRLRSVDGSYRWFLGRAMPLRSSDGQILKWFGTCTDLHELKTAQQAVVAAREEAERANRAKDEFLAALSHELRTPLTPVLLTAQLLENDPALSEDMRRDVRMIRRNVQIETRLIDDLLDLTRIARGKIILNRQLVDLHSILQEALETSQADMPEDKQLNLRVTYGASVHWVSADPARVTQVLWNIIKNAAKFTPDGGDVTIVTSNPSPGEIRVSITDTGRGIAPEFLPHIFTAFEQGGDRVTRQFGGLGLGLAISKVIMELHAGVIRAYSAGLGHGATFDIDLPVESPGQELPSDTTGLSSCLDASLTASQGLRILVVEDHENTGHLLVRLLQRMGFEVIWVTSCAEALTVAAELTFSLVISDLGLPDGSGHELMQSLSATYGLIGIALSGYGMEDDVLRSLQHGFAHHLVKPIDVEELCRIIQESLE